jgi:hypothetical protein
MEGEELREGKARVAVCLIAPLMDAGMQRKRGVSLEAHDKAMASLCACLAHMSAENLQALAEVVEIHAGGPNKNTWPDVVSVKNWARALQAPSASDSRLVRTYLQSAAGQRAVSEGYAVELYSFLKKNGAPPQGDYTFGQIKTRADDHRRTRQRIEADQQAGRATPSELAWLSGYWDAHGRCMDIINSKGAGHDAGTD